ncbi:MAG: ATP-binding protein [Actinomycetota bacterium]|nr:ATP-binding protein [Actinomycetota bacterium]
MPDARQQRPVPQLQLRLAADSEAVGTVRACVSEFVHRHGLIDAEEIVLAACQMSANAVLHAFHGAGAGGETEFEVSADFDGGYLRLEVTEDDAEGPAAPELGLGLRLVERVADDVRVSTPACGGTRVRARFTRAPPGLAT